MAVLPVDGIQLSQIHLLHRVEHEPGEVVLRQPLPQARRQQQLLLTITRVEVLSHRATVSSPPDGTPYATATGPSSGPAAGVIGVARLSDLQSCSSCS